MLTPAGSVFTKREKIVMGTIGAVFAAATVGGLAYIGLSQYAENANQAEHQRACAEDRARMNRPANEDETYVIPQGCYVR